jgi:hypothetical protein
MHKACQRICAEVEKFLEIGDKLLDKPNPRRFAKKRHFLVKVRRFGIVGVREVSRRNL